jgi:hypothetical protein
LAIADHGREMMRRAYVEGVMHGIVAGWNIIGVALLVNIVAIAILATPLLRWFGDDRVNTFVAYPPFVWRGGGAGRGGADGATSSCGGSSPWGEEDSTQSRGQAFSSFFPSALAPISPPAKLVTGTSPEATTARSFLGSMT